MDRCTACIRIAIFATILGTSHAYDIKPKILTDDTFEHDTQASTGQTTGIWAVRFCWGDAGLGHVLGPCSQTDAVWKRLASDLLESENIILADVRVDQEKGLLKRFEKQFVNDEVFKTTPVVIMFRRHMYVKDWVLQDDSDDERVFEEMREWITTRWETASSPQDVPPEPSLFADVLDRMSPLMKNPAVMGGIALVGVLIVAARGLQMMARTKKRD